MEAIRQVINSDLLDGVITLPTCLRNRQVEIIVFPTEEKTILPKLTKTNVDAMLKGSATELLIGALPYSDISLKDYRTERLTKYERAD